MKSPKKDTALGVAGWIALVVLAGFLAVAAWYAIYAWTAMAGVAMAGVAMSPAGWLFLILGALVTLGLGAGLMALVFCSSRHDFDQ